MSISTRQVLKESFTPKSLRCCRSGGIGARSQAARTAVIFTPDRHAVTGSVLRRRMSSSRGSGTRRKASTTDGVEVGARRTA